MMAIHYAARLALADIRTLAVVRVLIAGYRAAIIGIYTPFIQLAN
jgi:hypothetical protein